MDNEQSAVKISEDYGFSVLKRGNNEIYPMPAFVSLLVSDLVASGAWYKKLGFVTLLTVPGMMWHVRWIKFADLLLYPAGSALASQPGPGVRLNFTVWPEDISLDELATEWRVAGVECVGPTVTPWNSTELTPRDPDGYQLTFTQVDYSRLQQNHEFGAKIEQGYKELNPELQRG